MLRTRETKLEIVKKHLEDGITLKELSDEYGMHLEYERSIARFDDRKILAQRYLDDDDIKVNEQVTDNEDN